MIKTENITKALIGLVEDDGLDPQQVAGNFAKFAKKYKMENRVKNVIDMLLNREEEIKARNTIFIKTAHEIPERLIIDIKRYLNLPENASVNISIDKNILGGFKILYRNNLYEYSLKHKLNKLRDYLHSSHNAPIKIKRI